MKTFSYVATDVNGRSVKGTESAEDYLELVSKLREKNLFCTKYKDLQKNEASDVKFKFKTKDLAFISRQLSSMLTAGLSLVRALYILQAQQTKPKAKQVLLDIYEEVQKGKSFSEVLGSKPGVFPPLFVSMVGAGEASGSLDTIMTRVSEHYAKDSKTTNKIKGAMTYPIILLVLMLAIMVGMFTLILPMFAGMMDPEDMSPLTKVLLAFSDSLINYWYVYIIAIIVLIVVITVLLKTPKTRFYFDKLILKMPSVGKLIGTIYTGRFCRTMANLFASGLQMVECIEKSVATLGNSYVSEEFKGVIENVKQGEPLSKSIEKTGIFDGMFTSIVYVGEESGMLDDILSKSADFYEEESDAAIGKLVGMMEPLMIIVMGVLIGLFLAAVFPMLYGGMTNVT